jgi:DNA-binding transcriptional regulator YiaG
MDDALFEDLLTSLKQASAISKGKAEASRRHQFATADVKKIREQTGLSQSDFAKLMHVSIKTLQNWEQSRRYPTGPAVALLKLVSAEPSWALKTLNAGR